jgi:transposase
MTDFAWFADWSCVMLVAAPAAYTSQECSSCGHAEYADRNAAKNILRRGHEILSGGMPGE